MTSETKQARWAGQRQACGRCPRCGRPTVGPNVLCERHRLAENARNRRAYAEKRLTLNSPGLSIERAA